MNETFKGLSSDGNIESIDAFPNWLEERDSQRLSDASTLFNRLWNNSVPNIAVYKFPDAVRSVLKEKGKKAATGMDQIIASVVMMVMDKLQLSNLYPFIYNPLSLYACINGIWTHRTW